MHLELEILHMDSSLQWVLLQGEETRPKYFASIALWFLAASRAQIRHELYYFSPREGGKDHYDREGH